MFVTSKSKSNPLIQFAAILLSVTVSLLLAGDTCIAQIETATNESETSQKLETNEGSWIDQTSPNREYDFGDIQIGTSPNHEFEIKNVTSEALQIKSIFCSCGCIKASFDEQPIEPGKSTVVTVRAETEKFRGPKPATATVRFTDPAKEIQFSVKMNIRNLIVEPNLVDFRSMDLGGSAEQTIFVSRMNNFDWKISKLVTTHELISAKIVERTLEDGEIQYEILCKLSKAKSDIGSYHEIRVSSNDPAQPLINIPIRVGINPPLHVSNAVLIFKASNVATKQKLIVKSRELTELTSIEVDSEYFTASELNPGKKKIHIVEVTCVPNDKIQWDRRNLWGSLKVTTSNNLSKGVRLNVSKPVN